MENLLKRLQRVFEAEEEELGVEREYAPYGKLSPAQKKLVYEIVDIQRHIKELRKTVAKFTEGRKKVEPAIIKAIHSLEVDGIRWGQIVMWVRQGKTAPSYTEVLNVVQKKLKPQVLKTLQDAYKALSKKKERGEELYIKLGDSKTVVEGWQDVWTNVKEFFTNIFQPLIDAISGSITEVENLLGIKNEAAV